MTSCETAIRTTATGRRRRVRRTASSALLVASSASAAVATALADPALRDTASLGMNACVADYQATVLGGQVWACLERVWSRSLAWKVIRDFLAEE